MEKKNLTNEEYHKSKRISASGLKIIYQKSVYHYLNQMPFESSAMALGTAVHTALLEPEKFSDEYLVLPKLDLRTKVGREKYKDYQEKAKGRRLLKICEADIVSKICLNFSKYKLGRKYSLGDIESSYFAEIDGVEVRVRPDVYNQEKGFISDVKTCQYNSPDAFKRDCFKYNYPLQAYMYSKVLGVNPREFRFIAVETKHPFSCQVYGLSEQMISYGEKCFNKALDDWKFYLDTGLVLGYSGFDTDDNGVILL